MIKFFLKVVLFISLLSISSYGYDAVDNAKDKLRIHKILSNTMRFDEYLTDDIRKEFWTIVDKHLKISDKQLRELRFLLTANALDYMMYFYEDMLISLQGHSLYKSLDREKIEKFLLKNKITSEWRIKENDQMIIKALKGISVMDKDGNKLFFTKEVAYNALSRLDAIRKRVDLLFAR